MAGLALVRGGVAPRRAVAATHVTTGLAHPQVQTLDQLVDVPDEKKGGQKQVGFPFRYGGEERRTEFHRAPHLGEHTNAVLAEFVSEHKAAAGRAR